MSGKDALIALGMGGPDSLGAIEPFLKNLLNDREIINFGVPAPLQKLIAAKIAEKRSVKIAPHYEKIGGGSPQLGFTYKLLHKVAHIYETQTKRKLDTFAGMCYWHPFVEDTVKEVSAQDYRRIFLFPLYPQYSAATSGVCFNRFHKAVHKNPPSGAITRLSQYHMNEQYLNCLAKRVGDIGGKHLLFSAHSLPQSVVDGGDPYLNQLNEQIARIVDITKPASYSLAFQSKMGRIKWLTPALDTEMKRLADLGIRDVVILAISFINDHIETLIELDEDIISLGFSMGLEIKRAESLNDSDDFAEAVAGMLVGDRL